MTKLFQANPYIIAEVGSNHKGLNDCVQSISIAKMHGADAVKFQLFDHKALYGIEGESKGSIEPAWLPQLKEKADACDIELLCTAFSPDFVDIVDPYVPVHKIASSDLAHPLLLKGVRNKNKPVLISVGASSINDVKLALQELEGIEVVPMYCVSAYPSRQYNLFYMHDLKRVFNKRIGFSDHSKDIVYPALSALLHFEAIAIEKHVNFMEHQDTPDAPHSLNCEEFKFMCDFLRGKRPHATFNPMPEEKDMFLRHNRRLIACKPIRKGDILRFGDNFGAFRSLKEDSVGYSPFVWTAVDGKTAQHDMNPGDVILHAFYPG